MNISVKCRNCGSEIEITEALEHQLKEDVARKVLAEERKLHQGEIDKLKEKIEISQKAELELRKTKNELEEEKRSWNLEKQRQIDSERNKIRAKAFEEFSDDRKLKDKEKDKTIDDLRKALTDAQRKADQRSQQLQGEVLELDLQDILSKAFLTDEILEVKKGELGADLRHIVKTSRGTICGKILWEGKRTSSWSDSWISKLKEDMRKDKAHMAAIISEVMPTEIKNGMGFKDGVWIAEPKFVEVLALLLRKNLIDAAREKIIKFNKQTKAEELYDFVTSHEFTQQIERMIEIYIEMRNQVARERATMERSWKQREMQIDRLLSGVSGVYGSMQGIAGPALPQIRLLEAGDEEELINNKDDK